VPNI